MWVARPKTQAEIDAETAATNRATLTGDTRQEIDTLLATIDVLNTVIGPSGATAGTTSLRALKAQNNTQVVGAASIKALIDYDITCARELRRVARQAIRVARLVVDATSSTGTGTADT